MAVVTSGAPIPPSAKSWTFSQRQLSFRPKWSSKQGFANTYNGLLMRSADPCPENEAKPAVHVAHGSAASSEPQDDLVARGAGKMVEDSMRSVVQATNVLPTGSSVTLSGSGVSSASSLEHQVRQSEAPRKAQPLLFNLATSTLPQRSARPFASGAGSPSAAVPRNAGSQRKPPEVAVPPAGEKRKYTEPWVRRLEEEHALRAASVAGDFTAVFRIRDRVQLRVSRQRKVEPAPSSEESKAWKGELDAELALFAKAQTEAEKLRS